MQRKFSGHCKNHSAERSAAVGFFYDVIPPQISKSDQDKKGEVQYEQF